jgi:hypothetical protein
MEIAISPAIAATSPEPAITEPISPELVLVDPELRRALRAQALEHAPLQLVVDPEPSRLTRAPERAPVALRELPRLSHRAAVPAPAPFALSEAEPPGARRVRVWSQRYLVSAILPISLVLNAILITLTVSDATVAPEPTAVPPAPSAAAPDNDKQTQSLSAKAKRQPTQTRKAATARKPSAGASSGAARRIAPRLGARDAGLERKLLNLIVQAPAGKLPRLLINAKTGLAKNNLQAVCRRSGRSRSFLCVVQPAHHKPGEGLYVRYRSNPNGTDGRFTSYHYRGG